MICSIVLVIFNPKPKSLSAAMIFAIPVEDRIDINMKPNVDKLSSEMNEMRSCQQKYTNILAQSLNLPECTFCYRVDCAHDFYPGQHSNELLNECSVLEAST